MFQSLKGSPRISGTELFDQAKAPIIMRSLDFGSSREGTTTRRLELAAAQAFSMDIEDCDFLAVSIKERMLPVLGMALIFVFIASRNRNNVLRQNGIR